MATQQINPALMNIPGAIATLTGVAHIVSIYPAELAKEIPVGVGFKNYRLAAAPRDGYVVLLVEDSFQYIRDTSQLSDTQLEPGLLPVPQPARFLAESLVTYWTTGTVGTAGRPGIGLLGHGVLPPESGQPADPRFAAFLEFLKNEQRLYAQSIIDQAEAINIKHGRGAVSDVSRKMAFWLHGTAAERFSWYKQASFEEQKQCPRCAETIKAEALGCRHCSADLLKWYRDHPQDLDRDQFVKAKMDEDVERIKRDNAKLRAEQAALQSK